MMRKFIIEMFLLAIVVLTTGLYLFRLDTPSLIAKKVESIEGKLDIINLGTSHGNNFDYSQCNCNGKSFNKEGNTLFYDLQNYIYLSDRNLLSDTATIIIPISYFHFGMDENRSDRLPDDSFVNDFYYYLPSNKIYSYSSTKKKNLVIYTIQENFKKLINFNDKIESGYVNISKERLDIHARSRVEHHKKLSEFHSNQKNYDYLHSLIDTIINNGHIPVLVTTPYYKSYNNNFGNDWLDENYFKIMNEFSISHNIVYLNYSHDERFVFEPAYFFNSDHLNKSGRKVFSKIVFNDIFNEKQ